MFHPPCLIACSRNRAVVHALKEKRMVRLTAFVLVLASAGLFGSSSTEAGKYAEVWQKQVDGSWKAAVDIYNVGQ